MNNCDSKRTCSIRERLLPQTKSFRSALISHLPNRDRPLQQTVAAAALRRRRRRQWSPSRWSREHHPDTLPARQPHSALSPLVSISSISILVRLMDGLRLFDPQPRHAGSIALGIRDLAVLGGTSSTPLFASGTPTATPSMRDLGSLTLSTPTTVSGGFASVELSGADFTLPSGGGVPHVRYSHGMAILVFLCRAY